MCSTTRRSAAISLSNGAIDLQEIRRLRAAIAVIRRRVARGRKDWIPPLEMAIRELRAA
jgi:hypothetical protein